MLSAFCFLELRGSNLLDYIRLNLVSDLDVIKVFQADTTLEAFTHFRNVIFETTQRSDVAFPTDHPIANQSRAGVAANVAIDDHRAGNHTCFGNPENFTHVSLADDSLFFDGLEHANHRSPNFFFNLVND